MSLKKEVGKVHQVLEQRFLSSLSEGHGETGCSPADHKGPQWSRDSPAAHGEPCTRASGCLKEAVSPAEAHTRVSCCETMDRGAHIRVGFLAGLLIPQETHIGVVHEQMRWEIFTLQKFMEDVSSGRLDQRKDSSSWGRKGKDNVKWLTPNSYPVPLHPGRKGGKVWGMKLSPGKWACSCKDGQKHPGQYSHWHSQDIERKDCSCSAEALLCTTLMRSYLDSLSKF